MSSGLLIKFRSDFSQVNQGLDEARRNVSNFAQGVQNSLTSISFDSMSDVLGKMQFMLTAIGSAMMVPAMELEDVSKQLGVMMGSSADGSALASSLQRLATNGVVGMQELQSAAAALIGSFDDPGQIAQWVARFADISAGSKLSATRLAEMVARLDDMGKAEFTELANAGVPIFQALAEQGGARGLDAGAAGARHR